MTPTILIPAIGPMVVAVAYIVTTLSYYTSYIPFAYSMCFCWLGFQSKQKHTFLVESPSCASFTLILVKGSTTRKRHSLASFIFLIDSSLLIISSRSLIDSWWLGSTLVSKVASSCFYWSRNIRNPQWLVAVNGLSSPSSSFFSSFSSSIPPPTNLSVLSYYST